MTCDSAYLNEDDQIFEAFGEVHMVQGGHRTYVFSLSIL